MRAWSCGEWEDILSRSFVPLAIPVTVANFSGSADHRVVGEGVAVTAVRNEACRSERTSRHIAASGDDDAIFAMQLMGVCLRESAGQDRTGHRRVRRALYDGPAVVAGHPACEREPGHPG